MKNNNYKAFIFDMDGVIVNTEPIHVEAELKTCEHFGIKAPIEEWDNFKGKLSKEIFSYLIENYGNESLKVEELMNFKTNIYLELAKEKMDTFPGVINFLDYIRSKFEKIALTTSSIREFQETIFNKYHLAKYFDIIVTGNEITKGKPDPEAYLLTLKKLSLSANSCIVIEDSDNGVKSAKAAGCQVIGITHSFAKEKLMGAGADIVVNNFQELQEIL